MARTRIPKEDTVIPFLVAPLIYSILIPILIFVWIVNEILRTVVRLTLWYKYGHRLSLVNDGCDAVWNYKTNGNTRTVLITAIQPKANLDVENIADSFEKKVLLHEKVERSRRYRPYEKLEKILVTSHGYACWKYDENFKVRRQFRSMEAGKLYTESDMAELLSTLAEDMEEDKPQWEWIFFPRYQDANGEEKSLWIIRFHHAYMDGMSLLFMLSNHFSDNKPPLIMNPVTFKMEKWKKVLYYTNFLIHGPQLFISMILNKYKTYWTQHGPFPGGKKNLVSTPTIPMDLLRSIRASTGGTIPLIVGSSFVTAMKKVLPKDRILKSVRVGEIAAIIPYKNEDPQNRFTSFTYDISTEDIGENPPDFCDAIADIKRDRLGGMIGPESLLCFYAFKYFGRFPAFVLPFILDGSHHSFFFSNVPTFDEKLSCCGNVLDEFSPWPPIPNQTGITIACTSYNGKLKITGISDSSWLTMEELRQIFKEIPKVIEVIAEKSYIPNAMPSIEISEPGLEGSKGEVPADDEEGTTAENDGRDESDVEETLSVRKEGDETINGDDGHGSTAGSTDSEAEAEAESRTESEEDEDEEDENINSLTHDGKANGVDPIDVILNSDEDQVNSNSIKSNKSQKGSTVVGTPQTDDEDNRDDKTDDRVPLLVQN